MPRRLREELAGGVFHVYARGVDKCDIYRTDEDRRLYLRLLGSVVERQRWRCLAYCLMPNHIHLLLRTPEPNLGVGMRLIHGPYAQDFNKRYGRVGHLFQGRYGAVPVTDDAQLWTTVGYIAANPVKAGLTPDPAGWPWGSHRALVRLEDAPSWLAVGELMELLAAQGQDGLGRYRELVADRDAVRRSATDRGPDPATEVGTALQYRHGVRPRNRNGIARFSTLPWKGQAP
jgi:REP element-mobilizing transposase RayT